MKIKKLDNLSSLQKEIAKVKHTGKVKCRLENDKIIFSCGRYILTSYMATTSDREIDINISNTDTEIEASLFDGIFCIGRFQSGLEYAIKVEQSPRVWTITLRSDRSSKNDSYSDICQNESEIYYTAVKLLKSHPDFLGDIKVTDPSGRVKGFSTFGAFALEFEAKTE